MQVHKIMAEVCPRQQPFKQPTVFIVAAYFWITVTDKSTVFNINNYGPTSRIICWSYKNSLNYFEFLRPTIMRQTFIYHIHVNLASIWRFSFDRKRLDSLDFLIFLWGSTKSTIFNSFCTLRDTRYKNYLSARLTNAWLRRQLYNLLHNVLLLSGYHHVFVKLLQKYSKEGKLERVESLDDYIVPRIHLLRTDI